MEKDSVSKLFIPASILMGALIIAWALTLESDNGSVGSAPSPTPSEAARNAQPPAAIDMSKINSAGEPSIGSEDAPVTMFYWYDYQCPYCQRFESATMSKIVDEYVAAGKVRIIFKDLQFLGPESQAFGILGRAVWDVAPTKFYAWHKAVLEKQESLGRGWATAEALLEVTTTELGSADAGKAIALAETKAEQYTQMLEASKADGASVGVRSTPTSLIGGQLLVGAKAYEELKTAIDNALAEGVR